MSYINVGIMHHSTEAYVYRTAVIAIRKRMNAVTLM
jgi:hypothetical protein